MSPPNTHSSKILNSSQISLISRHQNTQKKQNVSFNEENLTLSNIKIRFLINKLLKRLKFLSAPHKKPEKVEQSWQSDLSEQKGRDQEQQYSKQTLAEEISNRFIPIKYIMIIQGILCILFAWLVTVSLVYKVKILEQVSIFNAFFVIITLVFKIKVAYTDYKKDCTYAIYWLEDFIEPFIFISANLLMIIRYHLTSDEYEYPILIFSLLSIIIEWRKIGKYFEYITIYAEQNKKRKELRIIQLFCFSFIMVHIFSLIMYAMTYCCPKSQVTWLEKANLSNRPWYVKYIYSYYWANTTMVTVGYGDLTPNNYVEAIVVTMIQIVGAATFGYMINVIGITVNEIQKKKLSLEQQQSTLNKLKWHYELSHELCYKMKVDIIKKDTMIEDEALKNGEEQSFLSTVDPWLKQQFVIQTNMKVIKKCIFFLTYFTINFQNQIALKLIRCIYSHDQVIDQEQNGQKQLIIINYGKVNIYFKKMRHNQQITKLAKVIELNQSNNLTFNNVYGYSSLITNKSINMKAISQTSSTCYILKRQDMMQSLSKSILDFQSFNELREKMLQYKIPQSVQVASLGDQEEHYIPNIYFLSKKIKNFTQQRHKIYRSLRKTKRFVITLKHYQNKTILYIPQVNQQKEEEDHQMFIMEQQSSKGKLKVIEDDKFSKSLMLDQARNFEKFFKAFNLSVISQFFSEAIIKKQGREKLKKITSRKSTIRKNI